MPKMFVSDPRSFDVIDWINAYSHASGDGLMVIDPAPEANGARVLDRLVNMPVIGLSFQKPTTHNPSFGFQLKGDHNKPLEVQKEGFEVQAVLYLNSKEADVPEGTEGITWELRILNAEDKDKFKPVVEGLMKEFNVNMFLNLMTQADDPDHLEERPVSHQFPDGPKICPIIILPK